MDNPTNTLWVLREAEKPGGFMPSAQSVGEFARSLTYQGLLIELDYPAPVFVLTDKGRKTLTALSATQSAPK